MIRFHPHFVEWAVLGVLQAAEAPRCGSAQSRKQSFAARLIRANTTPRTNKSAMSLKKMRQTRIAPGALLHRHEPKDRPVLPMEYREALQAMKEQAEVAGKMLFAGQASATAGLRSELAEIHRRIARNADASRRITRLLLTSDDAAQTIETLDEAGLAADLGF